MSDDYLTPRQVCYAWAYIFAGVFYSLATAYEFHRCTLIADAGTGSFYSQLLCGSWFLGMMVCWIIYWRLAFRFMFKQMLRTKAKDHGLTEYGLAMMMLGGAMIVICTALGAVTLIGSPFSSFLFYFKFLLSLILCGYMLIASGHNLWGKLDFVKSQFD